jgi:hypothetical protein
MTVDLGRYVIYVYRPCWPDVWNVCTSELAGGELYCTMKDSRFVSAGPGHLEVQGTLRLDWAGLSYSTTYAAPVGLRFDSSSYKLLIDMSSVTVDIVFLGITFTHYTFNVPYSQQVFIGGFYLEPQRLWAYPASIRVTVDASGIVISYDGDFK